LLVHDYPWASIHSERTVCRPVDDNWSGLV